MKINQMIVEPKKFHAMFISKKRNILPGNFELHINNRKLTLPSLVEFLRVSLFFIIFIYFEYYSFLLKRYKTSFNLL